MSKQEYPDTMRVGLFSPNVFREKGGVQRLSCELASYLVSQGHCVSILHTGGEASPCFPLPDVVRTQNVGEVTAVQPRRLKTVASVMVM